MIKKHEIKKAKQANMGKGYKKYLNRAGNISNLMGFEAWQKMTNIVNWQMSLLDTDPNFNLNLYNLKDNLYL